MHGKPPGKQKYLFLCLTYFCTKGAVVAADTLTFRSSSSPSKIDGSVNPTSFGVIASKIVCEPGAQTQVVLQPAISGVIVCLAKYTACADGARRRSLSFRKRCSVVSDCSRRIPVDQ